MKTYTELNLYFCPSETLKGREEKFCSVDVWVAPVLASWAQSMFAHEWVKPDGKIKTPSEMSDTMRAKRKEAEMTIEGGKPIMRPVLGVGIMDNIEIGSGRDIFLTLAACGATSVPVHIPKSHKSEFKVFIRAEEE